MPDQKKCREKSRFVLVDGSGYLYRAYHALPDLRTPDNAASGAVYGFISMLKRIRRDYPSVYGACVFDAKGKTFRNEIYPDYKANRQRMPDDLIQQLPAIHKAVTALGWPMLMIEGVEADDIIGTLTECALQDNLDVFICTGDKDMAQLVNEHVLLINTMNNESLDEIGVLKKFGVSPKQIIDYLSLIGDNIDNVPGVKKVGPKTAIKWLATYQSLEGIIASANEIKGVVGENLRSAIDWLPTAKKLLTIKRDCLIPISVLRRKSIVDHESKLKLLEPDNKELLLLYEKYAFKKWFRELEGNASEIESLDDSSGNIVKSWNSKINQKEISVCTVNKIYELVLDWSTFNIWLEKINSCSLTAFDLETTSRNPIEASIVGLSFCIFPGQACYIPVGHKPPKNSHQQLPIQEVLMKLQRWLEDPLCLKVGQNLKYDRQVLLNYHLSLEGIAHDTLLQSYVLESHYRHDLGRLAKRHLNLDTLSYEDLCGKGVNQICFDQVEIIDACQYGAEDADLVLRLHQILYPRIEQEKKLQNIYSNIEIPLIPILTNIERIGVRIDANLLRKQSIALGIRLQILEDDACRLANVLFNLNSPKQIGDILFNKLSLPILKKTPKGAPSTDDEVLQKLAINYPLAKLILDYRSLSKLKATYTDKLPMMVNKKTGRVHTCYGQTVAVTGRLVSTEPNLQNIPIRTEDGRRIREAFIADQNHKILSADYSQIELRIMAYLSQDDRLISAFQNDEDVHVATAAELFSLDKASISSNQRRIAKTINFGLIYGMSAFGLANSLNITREDAKKYIERYFNRYPKVADFMEKSRIQARKKGFVETVFGRRLWLPEINERNAARRQAAERAAINAPMQGTAADMIKLSMIAISQWLKRNGCQSKMIMQVHDELIFEVANKELDLLREELPKLMCGVIELGIPLQVDIGIGDNWDQAH